MIGTVAVPDAVEMRSLDAAAIDGLGIPGAVLMERAGLAAAHEVLQRHPAARRTTIVCGPGNNGGDGFVVARHLRSSRRTSPSTRCWARVRPAHRAARSAPPWPR